MALSLHKQPFVTTHFQFIAAHFVLHYALKNALLEMITFWTATQGPKEEQLSINNWTQVDIATQQLNFSSSNCCR